MKTFDDLEFQPREDILAIYNAQQATMNFENGYGVSVLIGECFYSNGVNTYEVGILYNEKLCYTTHITDDVLGRLTKDEVTETMKAVQEL